MPRYKPTGPTLSRELDQAFDHEWRQELRLEESREDFAAAKRDMAIRLSDVDPYGKGSPHSWVRDSAAVLNPGGDPLARERLNRSRAAYDKRAVSMSTLSFISGVVLPPWTAEAISWGLRSSAPLAAALMRIDPPETGDAAFWAKTTTAATLTAGSQSAENAAMSASADPVIAWVEDPLRTVAGFVDFSAQSMERSGAWFDAVVGEELGRAFGARLEQQIWAGTGSGGQMTGLTVMSGASSSTVAGQTLANQTAKIWAQYDAVANAVGSPPDLCAMAPRRAGGLGSLTSALGLQFEDALPAEVQDNIVISPASPTTLGGSTNEDWLILLRREGIPLVMAPEPSVSVQKEQAGTGLNYKLVIYAYCTLGVSKRPESVGVVKGLTSPTY